MLPGEWIGAITLTADSTVGGKLGFNSRTYEGPLVLSGPIDGEGSLSKLGNGDLTLSGENTFTGNLRLKGGYTTLASPASAGRGQIVFAGGGYRMTSADDPDISACRLGAGEHPVALFLDGDFTYEPSCGFTNQWGLYKMGPGKLVLSKPCVWKGYANDSTRPTSRVNNNISVEDGEVVLDWTNLSSDQHLNEMGTPTVDGGTLALPSFNLANNAQVTLRVPAGREPVYQSCVPYDSACATIRKEGPGNFQMMRLAFLLSVPSVLMMDVAEGEFYVYDNNTPGHGGVQDTDLPCVLNRGVLWKNESFACSDPKTGYLRKFTGFAKAWGDNCKTQVLSVTSALAANVPAHFNVGALYFNTKPTSGNVIDLKLTGTNIIASGVIFIGPDMGDTVVRISGGAIAMNPKEKANQRFIRLYNFNTNALARLEITSELSGDSYAFDASGLAQTISTNNDARLLVVGGGLTRFTGRNTIRGNVHVAGGNLQIGNADFLEHEAEAAYYLEKNLIVSGGGSLTFLEPGDFTQWHRTYKSQRGTDPRGGAWSSPQFHIYRPYGVINIPDPGQTVGLTNVSSKGLYIHAGATLVKKGRGELMCHNEYTRQDVPSCNYNVGVTGAKTYLARRGISFWDVQTGALGLRSEDTTKNDTRAQAVFGIMPTIARLRPGITLQGRGFLCSNMAYDGNHYTPMDVGNPIRYIVEPNADNPVLVDCARKCFNNIYMGEFDYGHYLGPRGSGLLSGSGDIRVINSGGQELPTLNPYGFVCEEFTGTISFEGVNLFGYYGLMIPNGGVRLNALARSDSAYHHYFTALCAPVQAFQVGRLTGDAIVRFDSFDDSQLDTGVYIGCNDGSTNVFSGSITFARSQKRCMEFVKIGNSIQEISGPLKNAYSPIYVSDGTYRVGWDCTQLESPVPSNYVTVYLGCGAQVAAGPNPRLTTSGPYTIVAPIKAWPEAGSEPEIGTDAILGTSIFRTGEISISNRVTFTAAGESTVIISNRLTGAGLIGKRGTGQVILAGLRDDTLAFGDLEGGGLTVIGDVNITEGAILNLSELDYSGRKNTHELLQATGEISGFENYTVIGLPSNWTIQKWSGRYVAVRGTGLQILFWGRGR